MLTNGDYAFLCGLLGFLQDLPEDARQSAGAEMIQESGRFKWRDPDAVYIEWLERRGRER